MKDLEIINADCRDALKHIPDESVDLGIHDPPFGIGESDFDKHYGRKSNRIIPGYQEAPQGYDQYYQWTLEWLKEAKRVLKPNGSMYVIMGHSNLRALLNATAHIGLHEINHIVWKYNFGVYTQRKYVTSHYHVIYYGKDANAIQKFNTHCRYPSHEIAPQGGNHLYQDLEDVFIIGRANKPGEKKNQNKLPDELLQKIVLYSSDPDDVICDFFMGNFTTAYVARRLGRKVCGFELNPKAYNHHMPKVAQTIMGYDLDSLRKIVNQTPKRQGMPVTDQELSEIKAMYMTMKANMVYKKDIVKRLQDVFQRGRFAIQNILDRIDGEIPKDPENPESNCLSNFFSDLDPELEPNA